MSSPFFIVGCERSGTTLLRAMLTEHSQLAIPKESHFLIKLIDAIGPKEPLSQADIQFAYSIITSSRRWQEWDCSKDELYADFHNEKPKSLADLIETTFRQAIGNSPKKRWGDKTPKYVCVVRELSQIFPNAQFIHIIRDGRDVCISYLKTNWYDGWIPKIAMHWKNRVLDGRASGQLIGSSKYLEVRYEDLVLSPENTLVKICTFLNHNYEPSMLRYHTKGSEIVDKRETHIHQKLNRAPEVDDVARWRYELPCLDNLVFECFTANLLDSVGYKIRYLHFKNILVYPLTRFVIYGLTKTASIRRKIGITRSVFRG